jgi:hypothetical protein
MMLLAISSPLLGIGLVMMLQVFETWALGGPNEPAHHSQQPHSALTIPRSGGQTAHRTDQIPLADAGRGSPGA